MKITEARLRQILREEARRSNLFEATGDLTAAPTAAPAPAAAAPAATPDDQLKLDLRDIMFGEPPGSASKLAKRDPLFSSDLVFDAPLANLQQGADDGDLADLPDGVKEGIFDKVLEAAKSGALSAETFHKIISDDYSEAMQGLDPPQKEDAMSRPGTDTFWPFILSAITKWKKAGGSQASAAPAAPSGAAPAAPGQPAAKPGSKASPAVAEIQKIVGMPQQDGKWGPATQAALEPFLQGLLNKGIVVANKQTYQQGVDMTPFKKNWSTISKLITKVNGSNPQPPAGWTGGGFPPTVQGILSFIKQLQAPAGSERSNASAASEGSWRRGSRINESERRVRIAWGR